MLTVLVRPRYSADHQDTARRVVLVPSTTTARVRFGDTPPSSSVARTDSVRAQALV